MGDRFTEISETGFLQNILNSIKGILVGLALLVTSFAVLWWNEGRTDMSKLAKTSIPVSSETIDERADGQLVSVTGHLESLETLGDSQFLREGPYIGLNRNVEMYVWVEKKSSKSRKKLGGGRVRETTYSYEKQWTESPPDSSSFRESAGHQNPRPPVYDQSFTVNSATVGAYRFDPRAARLPHPSPIPLTAENFIASMSARREGSYAYIGAGNLQSPTIGDIRIRFSAVKSGAEATLFGKLVGNRVEPYLYKGKGRLYRAIAGSRETAIDKMATEFTVTTWLFRGAGFLAMWLGLSLLFSPINAILDVIPLLGDISRFVIGLAMFFVALALSLLTMVVSAIAHNILLLAVTVAAVLFGVWAVGRLRPRARPAAAPAGTVGMQPLGDVSAQAVGGRRDEEEGMRHARQERSDSPEKIEFECEQCGKGYAVPSSFAGRKVRCKQCGHKFYLPLE